jgi:glycosyltransferase involved in cell wall biosynthesis
MNHPNPEVPQMQMASAAMQLADELGLTDTHVFFNHDWVPFERRGDWLLDADIGVSTHLDHVETAFSFRTRVLDYFWAGLPTVCTSGDAMEDLIRGRGAGTVVPPGDIGALATAIETLLDDPDARKAASAAASEIAADLHWSDVLAPLIAFCAHPQRAPDLLDSETAPRLSAVGRRAAQQRRGIVHAVRSAQRHVRNGRVTSVLTAGLRQVRRRITRR